MIDDPLNEGPEGSVGVHKIDLVHEYVNNPNSRGYIPPHLRHCATKTIPGRSFTHSPEYPEGMSPSVQSQQYTPMDAQGRPMSSLVHDTKPPRLLTYLASPYSHKLNAVKLMRFDAVTRCASWLIQHMKWNVFAPITHSHPLAQIGGLRGDWEFWKQIDEDYIRLSERLVVLELDGWRESVGVQAEIELAQKYNVPVVYCRCIPPVVSGSDGCYELAPYPMDEVSQVIRDADRLETAALSGFGLHRHPTNPTQVDWRSTATKPEPVTKLQGLITDLSMEKQVCEAIKRKLETAPEVTDHEIVYTFGDPPGTCSGLGSPEQNRASGPTSKATTANPKDIVGSTKVSLSKVPSVAIAHCAHAMMDGARKYSCYNWRAKKVQASIYVDAALRHLHDWFEGEEDATDSKVHHLGHAMACCAIILDCQETGNLIDDRPVTPASKGIVSRVFDRLREKIKTMPPLKP